ncbi:MAG TPA: PhnD/SsuA/transferrin family substrate-binding protein, partial [Pirellulaceae bacterium]|nr:PhnD/SsuA/transferrin family substrate-binding protein [Pirellulaceae bacterium]
MMLNKILVLMTLWCAAWLTWLASCPVACGDEPRPLADNELVLVVMDPLSAPLACDCVIGFAQRKYEHLGEYLTTVLQRPVRVVWGGAIDVAAKDVGGRADLIIGKHSVVVHDAGQLGINIQPLASLTGLDGKTTQTGLIIVRKDDPAQAIADLQGYRIFFGPAYCEEKSAAPIKLLKDHGVNVPSSENLETCGACSEAAVKLLELDGSVRAAAVISNYALALLEGCGTVQKGDLRVVGESEPVPFITMFVNQSVHETTVAEIRAALLKVKFDPALCQALETVVG